MVPSYHVWSTECVQSMLMERCTENQLSILHPSQLTARTLDIGSPDFVLWGMSRLSQKGAKLDMRDEPEAKLRCLSKCYAVHLGVSDTCPEQFGIKAFHRYFAVMTNEYFNTIFSTEICLNFFIFLQASILGLADLLSLDNSCLKTYKYKDFQFKELFLIGGFTSSGCLTVGCINTHKYIAHAQIPYKLSNYFFLDAWMLSFHFLKIRRSQSFFELNYRYIQQSSIQSCLSQTNSACTKYLFQFFVIDKLPHKSLNYNSTDIN
ncbi:hypothetical protein PHYBLDRAFT_189139 [Phycomyces blakesleeanus NRRL 1555(-)]|uniref:Uncharacterized protein n=1 Tax=Phycomyces blakesleeanus (strain ATCC 8743b / DSM 1359 / FGSC 10004 / NBRC 33097 / NRRL 1555) TaxID=763407 RepID=A0A162WHR5_PHYB8|nr:hypothetical protein PHYBLDRAFT_189139 [Phycomyces blakesleeanus NRRL 1555(-)]OAD67195.1 hypothetical protein PHYBLDRAFT_189139 [Phycomyces blakesleeanus NRRL 1555(-)]|eukprot:XP_018285235.1 hypothetical protein PHYBLDRAFT_189139 [Phycomyces blakesleeanus NRRL 1555(-)]